MEMCPLQAVQREKGECRVSPQAAQSHSCLPVPYGHSVATAGHPLLRPKAGGDVHHHVTLTPLSSKAIIFLSLGGLCLAAVFTNSDCAEVLGHMLAESTRAHICATD